MQDHWDSVYSSKEQEKLGWYQKDPQPDLNLILDLNLSKDATIVIAGAGTSTLVDRLLNMGYTNLILTDISQVALDKLAARINQEQVKFIQKDLGKDDFNIDLKVELWYDRAVLHFLTEEDQINNYKQILHTIRPKHIILGQFSSEGAEKCSGLPVHRYSISMLKDVVGDTYTTTQFMKHTYINPSGGERPYIYGVFQLEA